MKEKKNKERDNLIRTMYKKGLGGMLGRKFGISRQRIGQIVYENQVSFWRSLWNILIRKHLT